MNVMDGSIYTAPPERINARWCCNSTSNAVAIEQLQLANCNCDQLQLTNCTCNQLQLDQLQLRSTATGNQLQLGHNCDQLQLRSTATAINCNCDQLQLDRVVFKMNILFYHVLRANPNACSR